MSKLDRLWPNVVLRCPGELSDEIEAICRFNAISTSHFLLLACAYMLGKEKFPPPTALPLQEYFSPEDEDFSAAESDEEEDPYEL